jgi:hypothetical protein
VTSAPAWLVRRLAFHRVAVAVDADTTGDAAAPRLMAELRSFGALVERWRPTGAKDWNDLLLTHGAEVLGRDLADDQGQPVEQPEPDDPAEVGADAQPQSGFAIRQGADPGSLELRDPFTGQWVEVEALLG